MRRTSFNCSSVGFCPLSIIKVLIIIKLLFCTNGILNHYIEAKKIIAEARKDGQLVIFVGAGASISSGMPTWSQAIRAIAIIIFFQYKIIVLKISMNFEKFFSAFPIWKIRIFANNTNYLTVILCCLLKSIFD